MWYSCVWNHRTLYVKKPDVKQNTTTLCLFRKNLKRNVIFDFAYIALVAFEFHFVFLTLFYKKNMHKKMWVCERLVAIKQNINSQKKKRNKENRKYGHTQMQSLMKQLFLFFCNFLFLNLSMNVLNYVWLILLFQFLIFALNFWC